MLIATRDTRKEEEELGDEVRVHLDWRKELMWVEQAWEAWR